MKSIYLIIFFAMFTISGLAQSNVITKPSKVIMLQWEASIEPGVFQYGIFWCQGADTTIFPFNTGTDPNDLWNGEAIENWGFATVYNLHFGYWTNDMPGITYARLGVAPINAAGEIGLIKCISEVIKIKRPNILPQVWWDR